MRVVHKLCESAGRGRGRVQSGPVSGAGDTVGGNAGRWLRAVRRARVLSQRELAALAGVPLSTVSAIEAGRRTPGLVLFERILRATEFELAVVDTTPPDDGKTADQGGDVARPPPRRRLHLDDEHDAIRDRSGRRFPAHLRWGGKPVYDNGTYWWGWHNIAWYFDRDPAIVPDHVYWHRWKPSRLGRPARQHPFWTR